jgi:acyl carrier protein/D-alanine--poly(phosphoribitol) ligase subunit 2
MNQADLLNGGLLLRKSIIQNQENHNPTIIIRGSPMDDIPKLVLEYVKKEYLEEDDDREVNVNTPLISSGIVDSFSMVSLKRYLEKKFNIQIPDAEATPEAFDTVNSIVALVIRFRKA